MELTKQRGAHPLTIDGIERIVFFDMAATWLLVDQFGPHFNRALYSIDEGATDSYGLRLKSVDALQFFLWAGLQPHAKFRDEELLLADVAEFIRPWNIVPIFNAVVRALTGATSTPADPGKSFAVPSRAKKAAKKKVPRQTALTSTRRSASR